MAAPAIEAFGSYLRQLRERRGLSLDDVESLSSTFPDPIGKAYLSRCENGKLKIAFSKTIALCKIYEVPPEVLAERMRLDLEVDRIGGPDTAGKDFKTLYEESWDHAHDGQYWQAYALARDAFRQPTDDLHVAHVRDSAEQRSAGQIAIASMALQLHANALAQYELEAVDGRTLGRYFRTILLERLQITNRKRGLFSHALELADKAVEEARITKHAGLLAATLESRARTYLELERLDDALSDQKEAIALYSEEEHSRQKTQAYLRLADVYIRADRLTAARRVARIGRDRALAAGLTRNAAQALCFLGEIELKQSRPESARPLLQKASSLVRGRRNAALRLEIDQRLLECAIAIGDEPSRRSIERRLRRIIPAVDLSQSEREKLESFLEQI